MRYFLGLLFVALCLAFSLSAQTTDDNAATVHVMTIFDRLSSRQAGKGVVTVNQSDEIKRLVGARKYGKNVETTENETFLKIQGFRTQVFSGNNQRKSKDEAFKKEKEIKELFPDMPTYVTYNAPFWKLRVGDFRSHEEAYRTLRLLMDAFPSYAKEMYIVKEEVKIPLN